MASTQADTATKEFCLDDLLRDGPSYECPCDTEFKICRRPAIWFGKDGEPVLILCGLSKAFKKHGMPEEGTDLYERIVNTIKVLSEAKK